MDQTRFQASNLEFGGSVVRLFWPSGEQWSVIEPLLPKNKSGARPVDDRRIISGLVHVLKAGYRRCAFRKAYDASTTTCKRFNSWSRKRFLIDPVGAPATSGVVTKYTSWTAFTSRRTGRPMAVKKGGEKSGNRPVAEQSNHQNPCPYRVIGRPFAFMLTDGNAADSPVAPHLLAGLDLEF